MSRLSLLVKTQGLVLKHRVRPLRRGLLIKGVLLGTLALLFIGGDYLFFHRIFSYLRSIEEFPLFFMLSLTERLLGMVFLASFSMLLFSNLLTSISTLYLSRDLDLLMSCPIKRGDVFLFKWSGGMLHSSYMVLIFSLPIFAAYGRVFDAGVFYYVMLGWIMLLFILPPAAMGGMVSLSLMRFLPAKRTHQLLSTLGLICLVIIVVLIRLFRPEQLLNPSSAEDFVNMLDSLTVPSSPYLPSWWATKALMCTRSADYLTLSRYLSFMLVAAMGTIGLLVLVARKIYYEGWASAQESKKRPRFREGTLLDRLLRGVLKGVNPFCRALLIKDIKVFLRDATQWSQLFLLGALIFIYLFNIKNIPLPTPFFRNIVSFGNLGLGGFVLAAVAARFAFPATSVEGRSFWIIHSSPINYRGFLWSKFLLFVIPLLLLAEVLVYFSNLILEVDRYFMVMSLGTVFLTSIALTGLGVGMGALFPRFEVENYAKIAVGTGGLLFMIISLVYIAVIIGLEVNAVYLHLSGQLDPRFKWWVYSLPFYGGVILISALMTWLPMRLGVKALQRYQLA